MNLLRGRSLSHICAIVRRDGEHWQAVLRTALQLCSTRRRLNGGRIHSPEHEHKRPAENIRRALFTVTGGLFRLEAYNVPINSVGRGAA